MINNAADWALRCIAIGRNNWTFAGSDAGGRRACRIIPPGRIAELLPWNWKLLQQQQQRAAA